MANYVTPKEYGKDRDAQTEATAQRQSKDSRQWADMLAMLGAANRMDAQTLLGFGLGRLLRNYYQRGEDKKNTIKADEIANGGAGSSSNGQGDTGTFQNSDYMRDTMDHITGKRASAPNLTDYDMNGRSYNGYMRGAGEYLAGRSGDAPSILDFYGDGLSPSQRAFRFMY